MYVDLSNIYSGFCDRLRQLTFCIAYEALQKKKIIVVEIFENKNAECPFYISELIRIKNIKIKNVRKKKIQTIKMDPFSSEISLDNCKKYNLNNLDNEQLFKKWKQTYQLIIPKKKILSRINSILKKKKYVSIHTRLTDKLVSFKSYFLEIPSKDVIYEKQFQEFLMNIEKLIPEEFKHVYISGDENFFRKKIEKKLEQKFNVIKRKIKYNSSKLRQTSGNDFIIDLFVMSNSSLIISSTGGNVPYTSNLISGNRYKYIKWINYKMKYKFFFKIRQYLFFLRTLFKI